MEVNAVVSHSNIQKGKINETERTGCIEGDAIVSEMCTFLPKENSLETATGDAAHLELIRQLDCGAVSPFDSEDDLFDHGKEDFNQHLTEDIGLTSVQCALEMQRQMVDLQIKQNDTIVKVLEQQKETNKYLNEITKDKSENTNILGRHFEEQKNINNRLEELLTMFKTQVEIKVK